MENDDTPLTYGPEPSSGDANISDVINANSENDSLGTMKRGVSDPSSGRNSFIRILGGGGEGGEGEANENANLKSLKQKPDSHQRHILKTFKEYLKCLETKKQERDKQHMNWLNYIRSDETSW